MVLHINEWKWGKSFTIITLEGKAMIEVTISNDEPELAYLRGLSVIPSERRRGFGKALLAEAIQLAKSNGCKYVWLHADKESFVFEWYKKFGFKYYGEAVNENGFVPMFADIL